MANFLSPIGNGVPFTDANGNPLSGALLFTYVAGSSTKKTTYTDEDGLTPNANPIELDSDGYAPDPIWLIGGSTYKLLLAPAGDTDPPSSTIKGPWDNIAGINDTSVSIDQWITGPTPTFVDANTFTLVGDQTTDFHVNRRLKLTVSAGTVYGYISATAFTTLTTVDVVLDSGNLDAGLSAVQLALLTSDNHSYPNEIATTDTAQTISGAKTHSGTITMSGKPIELAEGAAVASATTTDIWGGGDGNIVHVTGTTTITSFGTAPQAGALRWVIFDGALTLTHGANLQCLGEANITTAAGDRALVFADTTTAHKVLWYHNLNGTPVVPSWKLITDSGASSSASIAFTSGITSTYALYAITIDNAVPQTDTARLRMRVSIDGGSNYASGAGSYEHASTGIDSAGNTRSNSADDTEIELSAAVSNTSNEGGISLTMYMIRPSATGVKKHFHWSGSYFNSTSDDITSLQGSGICKETSPEGTIANGINAVEFAFTSGNIVTGRFRLYGIRS